MAIKSIEDIARQKLAIYMTDFYIGDKLIMRAWPPMIAAKKAAAASPNFATEIYRIAEKMEADA